MLQAECCAEYEYTSEILLSRDKKFVPLYMLKIYTKKIEEKHSPNEEVDCIMKDVFS